MMDIGGGDGTWTRFMCIPLAPIAKPLAPPSSSAASSSFLSLARYDRAALRARFLSAEPFHHIVLDDFLDPALLAAAEQSLRALPEERWHDPTSSDAGVNDQGDTCWQSKKVAMANPRLMPPLVRQAMAELQSSEFIQFLADVSGIKEPLEADPSQFGAGVHRMRHGGHLSLHADFNMHYATGKYRRLNALLYLNSDWKPAHQGQLELWGARRCVRSLPPIFNRLVLFRITDDAVHGHPKPWLAPTDRLSFALYYYSDDRPAEEKTPTHYGAIWHK